MKGLQTISIWGDTRSNDLCSSQWLTPLLMMKTLNFARASGTIAFQVAKIDVTQCNGYKNVSIYCKKQNKGLLQATVARADKLRCIAQKWLATLGNHSAACISIALRHMLQNIAPFDTNFREWAKFPH